MRSNIPCNSATLIRNWFLSSSTRLRPFSMKSSNLRVNLVIRSRKSSKPKLTLGRVSAIDGASAEAKGGRIALAESEDSKIVVMALRDTDSNRSVGLANCWAIMFSLGTFSKVVLRRD